MIELFIDRRPLRVAVGTSVAAALALGGDGCSAARSAAGARGVCGMARCQACR
ncbi:(2Fe-2S)-binding protein, partial [Pseudomonas aeruginosa]